MSTKDSLTDYELGFEHGVEDRDRPILTEEELTLLIKLGDEYSCGYRDALRATHAPGRKLCTGCWSGTLEPPGSCDNCGLPGPKPPDYEWPPGSGHWITHYINHGNTWQSAPR